MDGASLIFWILLAFIIVVFIVAAATQAPKTPTQSPPDSDSGQNTSGNPAAGWLTASRPAEVVDRATLDISREPWDPRELSDRMPITVATRDFSGNPGAMMPLEAPTVSGKIRGISHWVDRYDVFQGACRLVREPDNEYDANAVAVYFEDRKVGYVPKGRAASYAPLLDSLGAPLAITYSRYNASSYPRLDMPSVPALRKFVNDTTKRPVSPSDGKDGA